MSRDSAMSPPNGPPSTFGCSDACNAAAQEAVKLDSKSDNESPAARMCAHTLLSAPAPHTASSSAPRDVPSLAEGSYVGDCHANAADTTPGARSGYLPPAPSAILKSVITSVLYPDEPLPSSHMSRWLDAAEALQLPSNPLDEIMTALSEEGVPAVELSGRQEVAGQRNTARERFQSGEAHVAVISDAASTGVSLHAPQPMPQGSGRGCKAARPRLHITLELNWSADRQIQQLGRSHRTGQACPPEHVLLVTDVCGEQRFVSTVARRLRSLGALSGDGGGISDGKWHGVLQSFETDQGSEALTHMYSALGFALAAPLGLETDANADAHSPTRAAASLHAYIRYCVRLQQRCSHNQVALLASTHGYSGRGGDAAVPIPTRKHMEASGAPVAADTSASEDDNDSIDDPDGIRDQDFNDVEAHAEIANNGAHFIDGNRTHERDGNDGDKHAEELQGCPHIFVSDSLHDVKARRIHLVAALQRAASHLLPDGALRSGADVYANTSCADSNCDAGGAVGVRSALSSPPVAASRPRSGKAARGTTPGGQLFSLASSGSVPMLRSKAGSVTFFLNRLLGLALADQKLLLHFFNFLLSRAVRHAHRNGSLDSGVETLKSPMILASALLLPEMSAGYGGPGRRAVTMSGTCTADNNTPMLLLQVILQNGSGAVEMPCGTAPAGSSGNIIAPSHDCRSPSPSAFSLPASPHEGLPHESYQQAASPLRLRSVEPTSPPPHSFGRGEVSSAVGSADCAVACAQASERSLSPCAGNSTVSQRVLLLELIPCASNAVTYNVVMPPEMRSRPWLTTPPLVQPQSNGVAATLAKATPIMAKAVDVAEAWGLESRPSIPLRGNFYLLDADEDRTGNADGRPTLPPVVFAAPTNLPACGEEVECSASTTPCCDFEARLMVQSPTGEALPHLSSLSALASHGYKCLDEPSRAATMWHASVAKTACLQKEKRCFLLCGTVQPYLARLQRIMGGRPPVRRVSLISGHTAVGLLVPPEHLASTLNTTDKGVFGASFTTETRNTTASGDAFVSHGEHGACAQDNCSIGNGHGCAVNLRWAQQLEDALRSQRRLQQCLPSSGEDERTGWQECWAAIKEHETLDLEPDEVLERKMRAEEVKDFALQVQRSKRARASAARCPASNGSGDALEAIVRSGASGTSADLCDGEATEAESSATHPVVAGTPAAFLTPAHSEEAALMPGRPPARSFGLTSAVLRASSVNRASAPMLVSIPTSIIENVISGGSFSKVGTGEGVRGGRTQAPAHREVGHVSDQRAPPAPCVSKVCPRQGFMPAVRAPRASAAMQRAAAQGALHPLLQLAAAKRQKL